MNKNEAAWLAIRVTGLAVALTAVRHIGPICYLAYMFFTGGLRDMPESISTQMSFMTVAPDVVVGGAKIAAAYYLLRHGRKIHALIMREGT